MGAWPKTSQIRINLGTGVLLKENSFSLFPEVAKPIDVSLALWGHHQRAYLRTVPTERKAGIRRERKRGRKQIFITLCEPLNAEEPKTKYFPGS